MPRPSRLFNRGVNKVDYVRDREQMRQAARVQVLKGSEIAAHHVL